MFYSDLSKKIHKARSCLCYFHVHVIISSGIELTESSIEDIYIFMGYESMKMMLGTLDFVTCVVIRNPSFFV